MELSFEGMDFLKFYVGKIFQIIFTDIKKVKIYVGELAN
jgi:hypothetical protein